MGTLIAAVAIHELAVRLLGCRRGEDVWGEREGQRGLVVAEETADDASDF